jgi:hypothetical protein
VARTILIAVLISIFLAGCSAPASDPALIENIVKETMAAMPTQTAYPTKTANPTYTPYPTYTNVPTQKPKVIIVTPTNTPTSTLTPTPINSLTPTTPPTNTPQPWQLTQESYKSTQSFYASYETVNQKDFLTYPDKYDGKKISAKCRIFNVADTYTVQCYFPYTYDAFYVEMDMSFDDLYEDEHLTIYGIGNGEKCFTNTMGNQVCQPLITDAFYTKP